MFSERNASLLPLAEPDFGLGSRVGAWSSPSLCELFERAIARASELGAPPPLAPRELAACVERGSFEEAVRGLSFILSPSEICRRVAEESGLPSMPLDTALERVVSGAFRGDMTSAERSVATMLHAVRVLGLDSEMHPGDKALDLVAPFAERLNVDLDPHFHGGGALSYRVLGAASLVAAQASLMPAAQPCGIQILRMAHALGIPRLMVTSHHSLGGDAVPLIAEHCAREGLLNGEISCPRLGYASANPEIFWMMKESPEEWLQCFTRLADLGVRGGSYILVVEDSLGLAGQGRDAPAIQDVIWDAYRRCERLALNPLTIASNSSEAQGILGSLPVGGLLTDLFIPTEAGGTDKACGEASVHEVLGPYLREDEIAGLLRAGRAAEGSVAEIMERETIALLTAP